jgi:hypothetical protein
MTAAIDTSGCSYLITKQHAIIDENESCIEM